MATAEQIIRDSLIVRLLICNPHNYAIVSAIFAELVWLVVQGDDVGPMHNTSHKIDDK